MPTTPRRCPRRSRFKATYTFSPSSMSVRRAVIAVALLCLTPSAAARADTGDPQAPVRQPAVSPAGAVSLPVSDAVVDGPPPPVAPAVITRDQKGDATLRAG